MGTDHTQTTPAQARAQLAASQSPRLDSQRDRTIHALGTAVFGLGLGGAMSLRNVVSGTGSTLLNVAYAAVLVTVVLWTERAARTVPRGTRRWSRLGIGASLVVALILVMPWLNLNAQTSPNTWPMVLGAALIVALPALVAAAVIARRSQ